MARRKCHVSSGLTSRQACTRYARSTSQRHWQDSSRLGVGFAAPFYPRGPVQRCKDAMPASRNALTPRCNEHLPTQLRLRKAGLSTSYSCQIARELHWHLNLSHVLFVPGRASAAICARNELISSRLESGRASPGSGISCSGGWSNKAGSRGTCKKGMTQSRRHFQAISSEDMLPHCTQTRQPSHAFAPFKLGETC